MYLFKASGATYKRVAKGGAHAFLHQPSDANPDEFVLLSKNREDCRPSEKQIRFAAKIRDIRPASPQELDSMFPGVDAGARWQHVIRLYNVCQLVHPFDLVQIEGFDATHYRTVQGYSRLSDSDSAAMLTFLVRTNPKLIIDMLNATGPDEDAELDL